MIYQEGNILPENLNDLHCETIKIELDDGRYIPFPIVINTAIISEDAFKYIKDAVKNGFMVGWDASRQESFKLCSPKT